MNDILSMIIGDEKLFEFYTSTQDEISTFLSMERKRRNQVLLELKSRVSAESIRQKEAVSKMLISINNNNCYALTGDILKFDLESEQLRREAASQDITVMVEMELSRQRAASKAFNALLDIRINRERENNLKFNILSIDEEKNKEGYDFSKKYKPGI